MPSKRPESDLEITLSPAQVVAVGKRLTERQVCRCDACLALAESWEAMREALIQIMQSMSIDYTPREREVACGHARTALVLAAKVRP